MIKNYTVREEVNSMTKRSQKGFTLVELLVVIAIIAILAGVLLVVINPASMLRKSRDSKRLQDIEALVNAINLATTQSEMVLTATAGCATCTSATGTRALDGSNGWVKFTIPATKRGLAAFVPTLPADPINAAQGGVNYWFTYASDATNFEVTAVLEDPDNAAKMANDGGNNAAEYELGTSLTLIN